MLTDIEIAQATTPQHISEIAEKAGVPESYLEMYGTNKAKVDYNLLKDEEHTPGKLILVTAINPTPAGEGKTTTTVGLADALAKQGKNVVVALREPSLGPVFGIKDVYKRQSTARSVLQASCLPLPAWRCSGRRCTPSRSSARWCAQAAMQGRALLGWPTRYARSPCS